MLNKFFILIGMMLVSLFPINAQIFKYIGMDKEGYFLSNKENNIISGYLPTKGQTVTTENDSPIITFAAKGKR